MAENTTNSNANMADVVMQQKGAEGAGAIPFCGCVCCFSACFTEWPECFGCAGKGNCLCYHATSRACKFPTDDPDDKDMWFLCSRGQSHFGPFQAICSQRSQNFCLDSRAALPPIDDIPCMLTLCFFTIVYKGKTVTQFFKSLGELDGLVASAAN